MELVGDFRLLSPAGLIQALCQEERAVLITAQRSAESAVLTLADGLVLNVICADRSGEDALVYLLHWDNGQFRVEPLLLPIVTEPLGPWEALVLEAARRRDESTA